MFCDGGSDGQCLLVFLEVVINGLKTCCYLTKTSTSDVSQAEGDKMERLLKAAVT